MEGDDNMKCNICNQELADGKLHAYGLSISWSPKKRNKELNIVAKRLASSPLRIASTKSYYCPTCDIVITPVREQVLSVTLDKINKSVIPKKHKKAPVKSNNIYSTRRTR